MPPREDRPAARASLPAASTRRRRTTRAIGLPGAVLCAALSACGAREDARPVAAPATPVVEAPARPESVRIEGRLRDLGRLAAALPPMVSAAMPTRAAELLAGGCALPTGLESRIANDAQVAFAFARPSADEPLGGAFAAAVRIDAGVAPLGADTTLVDDAEHGVRWVGRSPAEGRSALALVGDALVCAETPELARALGPYVARTLLPRMMAADPAARAPVHATLLPGAVSEDLHRFLSAELARATLEARQAAARGAQTAPAASAPVDLGSAVVALRNSLRPRVELLIGAGAGSITIESIDSRLVMRSSVASLPGSPFAAALATLPRVARSTLGALPAGASIGAVFGSENASAWAWGEALRAAIDAAAGTHHVDAAGASLDAALASMGAARAPAVVVAAGMHDGAAFAQLGVAGATGAPDAARLQAALDAPFLRDAIAQRLGCEAPRGRAPAPRAVELGGASVRALRVCGAPLESESIPPYLNLATRPSGWSLHGSRAKTAATSTRLAADSVAALAGAAPAAPGDAAFAALPERFSVGLSLRPAALPALFDALSADGGAAPSPAPEADAAILLALDHDAGGAHLTLLAPGAAIAALVGAFGSAGANR